MDSQKAFLYGACAVAGGVLLERSLKTVTFQNFARVIAIVRGAVLDFKQSREQGTEIPPVLLEEPQEVPPSMPTGAALASMVPAPSREPELPLFPNGHGVFAASHEQVMAVNEFKKRQKEMGSALQNKSWKTDL